MSDSLAGIGRRGRARAASGHRVALILLDALRDDFGPASLPAWGPVLDPSEQGRGLLHGANSEMFGFMTRPAFLAGLHPEQSDICTMFRYGPNASPFGFVHGTTLRLLRMTSVSRKLERWARKALRRIAVRRVNGALSHYLTPIEIPFELLRFFDFSEKLFAWEGYAEQDSVFRVLDAAGEGWVYLGYPLVTDYSSDERLVDGFRRGVDADARFVYLHLSALDGAGHSHGPDSREYRDGVLEYQRLVERAVRHLEQVWGEDFSVVVFGDHGMIAVDRTVDVWGAVAQLDFVAGEDFVLFLDSTMARVWILDERCRDAVTETIAALPGLRLVDDAGRAHHRIRFPHDDFGELIFLADPGVVVSPNFFQRTGPVPVGMHGYDPDAPGNRGALMISTPRTSGIRGNLSVSQTALFPTVMDLMGLAPTQGSVLGENA